MPASVWKYELVPNDDGECVVNVPREARILSVGGQADGVFVWVLVPDIDQPVDQPKYFVVKGTGHTFDAESWPKAEAYLGRASIGSFEFHVFEDND